LGRRKDKFALYKVRKNEGKIKEKERGRRQCLTGEKKREKGEKKDGEKRGKHTNLVRNQKRKEKKKEWNEEREREGTWHSELVFFSGRGGRKKEENPKGRGGGGGGEKRKERERHPIPVEHRPKGKRKKEKKEGRKEDTSDQRGGKKKAENLPSFDFLWSGGGGEKRGKKERKEECGGGGRGGKKEGEGGTNLNSAISSLEMGKREKRGGSYKKRCKTAQRKKREGSKKEGTPPVCLFSSLEREGGEEGI